MKFATATSRSDDTAKAVRGIAESVSRDLGGSSPTLALVFASPNHADELDMVVSELQKAIRPTSLLGCVSESIIGGAEEFEDGSALTLWAAVLPDTLVESQHIEFQSTPDGIYFTGTPTVTADPSTLLLISSPAFRSDIYLQRCDEDFPNLQILGGVASGARIDGRTRMIIDSDIVETGAVGVLISGGVNVRPIVSQGCRPFGRTYVITKADQNSIVSLKGRPAKDLLVEEIALLAPEDRQLLTHGLHIGLAIDASKQTHSRGDFLVRNVLGIEKEGGAIFVTDFVRAGQTIQFHLRDAGTASEDLHILLRKALEGGQPAGALLFTCNGRGKRLFQAHSHDSGAVTKELGNIPLAGFFAAGEIGPIGGKNFLHGFTASVVLFGE